MSDIQRGKELWLKHWHEWNYAGVSFKLSDVEVAAVDAYIHALEEEHEAVGKIVRRCGYFGKDCTVCVHELSVKNVCRAYQKIEGAGNAGLDD